MGPKVGVVLINYRSAQDTLECVRSLLGSTYEDMHVWVIDNASEDDSIETLRDGLANDAGVTLVPNDENLGFGLANNQGMELAFANGCEYALLLNNDTVVDERMVEELVSHAAPYTVIAPLIVTHKDPRIVWFAGGSIDRLARTHHHLRGKSVSEAPDGPTATEFLTGCCMMLSRNAFLQTGGFGEEYFLYWEDADLCMRLRAKGFTLLLCPKAVVQHKVSASTGGTGSLLGDYYYLRNRLYFARKFGYGAKARLACMGSLAVHKAMRGYDARGLQWGYADFRARKMGKTPRFA